MSVCVDTIWVGVCVRVRACVWVSVCVYAQNLLNLGSWKIQDLDPHCRHPYYSHRYPAKERVGSSISALRWNPPRCNRWWLSSQPFRLVKPRLREKKLEWWILIMPQKVVSVVAMVGGKLIFFYRQKPPDMELNLLHRKIFWRLFFSRSLLRRNYLLHLISNKICFQWLIFAIAVAPTLAGTHGAITFEQRTSPL